MTEDEGTEVVSRIKRNPPLTRAERGEVVEHLIRQKAGLYLPDPGPFELPETTPLGIAMIRLSEACRRMTGGHKARHGTDRCGRCGVHLGPVPGWNEKEIVSPLPEQMKAP